MAISLSKGQKVDLTKTNPGLKNITVGLGWDTNRYDGQHSFDLDTAAFLLDENGKVSSDMDFIFYNNLKHASESVIHLGDNLTGQGAGDDEQMSVLLDKIPQNVSRIAFTATIHEASERGQNFGQVSNAYIHVLNAENGQELIRYDLGEDFSIETAVVIGELYRNNGQWKFNAIGSGYQGGLRDLCNNFGINI